MAKQKNVYDGVSYDKLRNEVKEIIVSLALEDTENIEDSIHYKQTAKGGVIPSITSTIEAKIETDLITIETCCKILKSLVDKEGLSEFTLYGINALTDKIKQIQSYYETRPISKIKDRLLKLRYGKGTIVETLAQTKENQKKSRIKISEKILKIIPLIGELESLKEAIQVKGGYEIPHRMKLKRNNG